MRHIITEINENVANKHHQMQRTQKPCNTILHERIIGKYKCGKVVARLKWYDLIRSFFFTLQIFWCTRTYLFLLDETTLKQLLLIFCIWLCLFAWFSLISTVICWKIHFSIRKFKVVSSSNSFLCPLWQQSQNFLNQRTYQSNLLNSCFIIF